MIALEHLMRSGGRSNVAQVALVRLCYGEVSQKMVQALCDLAEGYAREGLWPQVRSRNHVSLMVGRGEIKSCCTVVLRNIDLHIFPLPERNTPRLQQSRNIAKRMSCVLLSAACGANFGALWVPSNVLIYFWGRFEGYIQEANTIRTYVSPIGHFFRQKHVLS